MPWYGIVLIILAGAVAFLMAAVGVAVGIMATRKTPKPPERGRS